MWGCELSTQYLMQQLGANFSCQRLKWSSQPRGRVAFNIFWKPLVAHPRIIASKTHLIPEENYPSPSRGCTQYLGILYFCPCLSTDLFGVDALLGHCRCSDASGGAHDWPGTLSGLHGCGVLCFRRIKLPLFRWHAEIILLCESRAQCSMSRSPPPVALANV